VEPGVDVFLGRVNQLADEGTRIESLDAELAVLRPPDPKVRIVVARARAESPEAIIDRLAKVMRAAGPLRLEIVLVGGSPSTRALLEKARPRLTGARQRLYHQSDSGVLWCQAEGATAALLATPPPPLDEAALAALRRKAGEGHAAFAQERAELAAFVGRQRAGRPVLTWTALGIIAAMFGLEALFGGVDAAPTLIHLGAFYSPLVKQGEFWRFASCTFLHSGALHVLMNGYVLYALSPFLENILGRWRFALLYAAAAFGGSLASFLAHKQILSVGASGALWGCLGAHAVLAFRPGGLLPRAMIPGAQRAAGINLFLNVMISLHPRVDWAAHAGGGLVGAALLYLLLRRGLPQLADAGSGGAPPVDRRPRIIAPLATVLCALLLGGLVLGVVRGRAWELRGTPELATRQVSEFHASLGVPSLLARREGGALENGGTEVVFGELPVDPALVAVAQFPIAADETGDVATIRQQVREELRASVPRDATPIEQPADVMVGGRPAVRMRYRYSSGVELETVAVLFDKILYRVQTAQVPGYPTWNDLAMRVAASLRPEGAPAD